MFDLLAEQLDPGASCWVIVDPRSGMPLGGQGNYGELALMAWSSRELAAAWQTVDARARLGRITAWTLAKTVAWCQERGVAEIVPDQRERLVTVLATLLVDSVAGVLARRRRLC